MIVKISLNTSIVLIPTIIGYSNIRRNFKKDIQNLNSLKEEFIMFRYALSDKILNENQ